MNRDLLEAMADELLRGRKRAGDAFGDFEARGHSIGSDPAAAREAAKDERRFDDLLIKKRRASRSLVLSPRSRFALTVANAPVSWLAPVERGPTPISKGWRDSL